MPKITIMAHLELCPKGAIIENVTIGTSICEAMLENGIPLEHACEMSCACTTCHVIVCGGGNSLNIANDSEEDLLDRAWGLEPNSRLACQAIVANDDLVIKIPRYSINHAKEHK